VRRGKWRNKQITEEKGIKNSWGERKLGQKRAKQIDIWIERKREIVNNGL
jgi:hypothetical protein